MINLLPSSWYSLKTKQRFFDEVDSNLKFSVEYFIQFTFSIIIATLGLIKDSNEVVIGAMLLSPLFWPIMGVTTGLISSKRHLFEKSIKILIQSIIWAFVLTFIIATLIPNVGITEEIKARINPTIIDLLIALASSIVGVFLTYSPRTHPSIAGVAISLSLLPPLCVAGIGVSLQIWVIFLGGLLLFLANFAAIVFFGMFTLYLLGFRPHHGEEEKRWKYGLIVSSIFLILISIPLTFFFIKSITQERIKDKVIYFLKSEIKKFDENAEVDKIVIDFGNESKINTIIVDSTVYVPEGKFVTASNKEDLVNMISHEVNIPIELNLNLVNTLKVKEEKVDASVKLKEEIELVLTEELRNFDKVASVEKLNISFPQDLTKGSIYLEVLILKSGLKSVDNKLASKIESKLNDIFNYRFKIKIDYIDKFDTAYVPEDDFKTVLEKLVKSYLVKLSGYPILDKLEYYNDQQNENDVNTIVFLKILEETEITEDSKIELEELLSKETKKNIHLDLRYEYFKKV